MNDEVYRKVILSAWTVNLDKASVRTEDSRLKADFEKLCAEGKITSESQAIMNSLLMVVELIPAIFLERTTKKDTTNSSKPSSQTGKDESALSHSGSNGKGKPENKAAAQNRRTVLGQTVRQILFPDGSDPLGRYVIVGNIPFEVIDVMEPKGADAMGSDCGDSLFVPLTTGLIRLFGQRYLGGVTVKVRDVAAIDDRQ